VEDSGEVTKEMGKRYMENHEDGWMLVSCRDIMLGEPVEKRPIPHRTFPVLVELRVTSIYIGRGN